MHPLPPGKILKMTVVAHRNKRDLQQVLLLASRKARFTSLFLANSQGNRLQSVTERAEMPLGEPKEWNGESCVRDLHSSPSVPVIGWKTEMVHIEQALQAPLLDLELFWIEVLAVFLTRFQFKPVVKAARNQRTSVSYDNQSPNTKRGY